MSITDAKLIFSDSQAMGKPTTASTQIASTNVLDLGAAKLDIGAGTPLYLNIRIVSAPASFGTTHGTGCFFRLQGGSSSVASGSVWHRTPFVPQELMTAGRWVARIALPGGIVSRYLRLLYVLDSSSAITYGATTVGAFNAWISGATPETNVGT